MEQIKNLERVVIVGGGKMGEAILSGWLAADAGPAETLDGGNVLVVEPTESRREFLSERYGVSCVSSVAEVEHASLVVLAVKPQVMMGLLEQVAQLSAFQGGEDGPLFVSIAAGLTTERLEGGLPADARLVRVMPNTPLMVGAGATAVTAGLRALPADAELVCALFGSLGVASIIEESAMDAVCAVSGSGPAYVAAMVESLRDAGVRQGLPAELAEQLALQTVYGTALLIKETGEAPETIRKAVCSPGGTTLAALEAMEAAGFDQVFDAGVAAAVRRSKELALC